MMCKSNNKGFSLIDVIIAVAVMSILISPIIAQVITTIDTSSRAKERQYVIDNADMVMDYFRTKTVKELEQTGYKGDPVSIKEVRKYDGIDHGGVTYPQAKVELFNFGSEGAENYETYTTYPNINYECTDYILGTYDESASDNLSTVEILGRGKKEYSKYSRIVTLDDLSAVALSNGLKINYYAGKQRPGESKSDFNDRKEKLQNAGFEFTSEGSAVKYDSNGHVTAVACLNSGNSNYKNPNNATPVITDIDSQKMAIIEGDASTIDNQFENDIIKEMVSYVNSHKTELRKKDSSGHIIAHPDTFEGETLYDFLTDNTNLNEELNTIRSNNTFRRAIRLYVTGEDVVSGKPSYYHVKCVVSYYAKYTSDKLGSLDKCFTYTVFDQKFNTEQPPDVFFVYEPLVLKTNAKTAEAGYSPYEFFYVTSDDYTSGVNTNPDTGKLFEPSKIYLIKAETNWAQAVVNKRTPDQIRDAKETNESYYYFLTKIGGTTMPVKIFVNQIKPKTSTAKPLQIITNISWRPNHATGNVKSDDPIINELYKNPTTNLFVSGGWQFFPNKPNTEIEKTIPSEIWKPSDEKIETYPLDLSCDSTIDSINYSDGSSVYAIDAPTEDTVEYGRLYTITIKYNNVSRDTENKETGNKAFIYFTGAKGAD